MINMIDFIYYANTLIFHVNHLLGNDSHAMSSHCFPENVRREMSLKLSFAAVRLEELYNGSLTKAFGK